MNVVLINESEKKAWVRSRRILGKYLHQIGSKTWSGHISEEGLMDLYGELKASASKNTAVACHRVTSRKRIERVWVIGSQDRFDAEGRYAYRISAGKPFYVPPTKHEAILREVVSLAALCHDFGKILASFQKKLRGNQKIADGERHELVTAKILMTTLAGAGSDGDWIEKITPENLAKEVLDGNKIVGCHDEGERAIVENLLAVKNGDTIINTNTPIGLAVLWLVLAHHRLPAKDVGNLKNPTTPFCATAHLAAMDSAPWHIEKWKKTWSRSCRKLSDLIKDKAVSLQDENWWQNIAFLARPALIAGDGWASSAGGNTALDDHQLWAKSKDTHGLTCDLATHLLDVRFRSLQYLDVLMGRQESGLDSVPSWAISKRSPIAKRAKDRRFRWQDESAEAVAMEGIGETPFIGFVLAETGAGKTIGATKIMRAAQKGDLRVSYLLGYRSLAFQVGSELQHALGKQAGGVAVVVGNSGVPPEKSDDGIEMSVMDEIEKAETLADVAWADGSARFAPPDELRKLMGSDKNARIATAPVLVATMDHVAHAAEMLKASESRTLIRVATSDAIIDEIDSYSTQDLVTLTRLVFLHGLYRRKTLLVSATMTPEIVQGFTSAYKMGIGCAAWRKNQEEAPCRIGFFSNLTDPVVVESGDTASIYGDYAKSFVESMDPRREMGILDLPSKGSQNEIFASIFREAKKRHGEEIGRNSDDKERISFGFVRFNKVRHAQAFARWLNEAEPDRFDGLVVKVVCYHAKFPTFVRGFLDDRLETMMNRKDNTYQAISEYQSLADEVKKTGTSGMVIVSTTSIQETGRDHDYDWAILEPHSVRSMVQALGRVWRHRPERSGECASILSAPIESTITGNAEDAWVKPGILDAKKTFGLGVKEPTGPAKKIFGGGGGSMSGSRTTKTQEVFCDIFSPEKRAKIDGRYLLLPAGKLPQGNRTICQIEHSLQGLAIEKAIGNPSNGGLAGNPSLFLRADETRDFKFRGSDSRREILFSFSANEDRPGWIDGDCPHIRMYHVKEGWVSTSNSEFAKKIILVSRPKDRQFFGVPNGWEKYITEKGERTGIDIYQEGNPLLQFKLEVYEDIQRQSVRIDTFLGISIEK